MTRRFEGAITTPDDEIADSSLVPAPERPPRPMLIELGAAILIVGGFTSVIGWIAVAIFGSPIPTDAGPVPLIVVGLNVVVIAIGLLMHSGRLWRLCVNFVAVTIFLYLTFFPNPIAVFYLFLDTIVFVGLVRHRWWFEWKPRNAPAPS